MVNPNSISNPNNENQNETTDWDILTDMGDKATSMNRESLPNTQLKEVEIPTEGIARIETSDAPMGKNRQDKRVDVVDSERVEKRTSNLMLGYNKREVQIDEKYYSIEDIQERAIEYLERDDEDVVYYTRRDDTEKRFCEPKEVVEDIAKDLIKAEVPKIDLSPADSISNQDARHVEAHGANGEKQKGVFMLGNIELKMPNGTYISADTVEQALNNYLKAVVPAEPEPPVGPKPPVGPIGPPTETPTGGESGPKPPVEPTDPPSETPSGEPEPTPREPESGSGETEGQAHDQEYRVIKRIKETSKRWAVTAALATSMLLAALGGFNKEETSAISRNAEYDVSTTVSQTEQVEMSSEEAYDTIWENTVFSIKTGETAEMPAGVEYHESSDYASGGANNTGVFGEGIREAGEYKVEYISIIGKDGEIKDVNYQEGQDLGEFVKEVSEREGIPEDELSIKLHIGGPVSGWVDVADIAQKKLELSDPSTLTKEVVVDKDEQFSGSVENFDGKANFINEKGETVEVNFQKEDGTMAQAGETVIGSDGREYQVENLDVKATETGETRTTWSLADAAKVAALAGGASAALLAAFGRKRKEKEMTDMTGAQIRDLILDSEQNYELGEGEEFNRDVEKLLREKGIEEKGTPKEQLFEALVEQEITVEEIRKLKEKGE